MKPRSVYYFKACLAFVVSGMYRSAIAPASISIKTPRIMAFDHAYIKP